MKDKITIEIERKKAEELLEVIEWLKKYDNGLDGIQSKLKEALERPKEIRARVKSWVELLKEYRINFIEGNGLELFDRLTKKQLVMSITEMEHIDKEISVIYTGDFNDYRWKTFDGSIMYFNEDFLKFLD